MICIQEIQYCTVYVCVLLMTLQCMYVLYIVQQVQYRVLGAEPRTLYWSAEGSTVPYTTYCPPCPTVLYWAMMTLQYSTVGTSVQFIAVRYQIMVQAPWVWYRLRWRFNTLLQCSSGKCSSRIAYHLQILTHSTGLIAGSSAFLRSYTNHIVEAL